MNSTIQIRIDKKMKKDADKTLKDMGLDMSSGIKLFLNEIIRERSLPFRVLTTNGYTPEYEERMIREGNYALKHGKSYKNAKEIFNDILKD